MANVYAFFREEGVSGLQGAYAAGPNAEIATEATRGFKVRAHSGGAASDEFCQVYANNGTSRYRAVTRDGQTFYAHGSVTLPSIGFGDSGTGLYRSALKEVSIATDGNQRVAVLETGFVGLWCADPATTLDLNGAQTFRGMAAPAVSPSGRARLYFDSTSNTLKLSQNGGAYTDVGGGALITAHNTTDDNVAYAVFDARRSRSSATAPGAADFGADITYTLEGSSNNSFPTAVRLRGAWEVPQTNDTTARDAYFGVSLIRDGTLTERFRIGSGGRVQFGVTPATSSTASLDISCGSTGSTTAINILRTGGAYGDYTAIVMNELGVYTYTSSGFYQAAIWNNYATGTPIINMVAGGGAAGTGATGGTQPVSKVQLGHDLLVSSTANGGPRGRISAIGESSFAPINNHITVSTGTSVTTNGVSFFFSSAHIGSKIRLNNATNQTRNITAVAGVVNFTIDEAFSPDIASNTGFIILRPLMVLQDSGGTNRWRISDSGQLFWTGTASTGLELGHEEPDVVWEGNRTVQWLGGTTVTLQRAHRFRAPTYSFATSATNMTTAVHVDIGGAPNAGTNATIVNSFALRVGADGTTLASTASLLYAAIQVPDHTLTLTGTTTLTSTGPAGLYVGQLTLTDASALTVNDAASLYIKGAPVAAGSVTLTNPWSLWVDAGTTRLDGDLRVDGSLDHNGSQIAFFNAALASQQAIAALTNNVTAGGTTDVVDDWTDLTTYANDAPAIRNAIYQLARKLAQVVAAERLYGLYS